MGKPVFDGQLADLRRRARLAGLRRGGFLEGIVIGIRRGGDGIDHRMAQIDQRHHRPVMKQIVENIELQGQQRHLRQRLGGALKTFRVVDDQVIHPHGDHPAKGDMQVFHRDVAAQRRRGPAIGHRDEPVPVPKDRQQHDENDRDAKPDQQALRARLGHWFLCSHGQPCGMARAPAT